MRHIIGWLAIAGLVIFLSLEARPVRAEEVPNNQTEKQTLMEKAGVSTNLQDQVAVLIQKSILLAEKTGEFVVEQTSDVVKQFLTWKFWQYTVYASILFLIALSLLLGSFYAIYKGFDPRSCLEVGGVFIGGIGLIVSLILGGASIDHALKAVQISIAPKVYLLEWVADKYKGNNSKQ